MPQENWSATAIAAASDDMTALERLYHAAVPLPNEHCMVPDKMPQRKPEAPMIELTADAVAASLEPAVHEGEQPPQVQEPPKVEQAQPAKPGLGWSFTRPWERRYIAALSATVSQGTVFVPRSGLLPEPALLVDVTSHAVSPRKWRSPFVLEEPSQLAIGTLQECVGQRCKEADEKSIEEKVATGKYRAAICFCERACGASHEICNFCVKQSSLHVRSSSATHRKLLMMSLVCDPMQRTSVL